MKEKNVDNIKGFEFDEKILKYSNMSKLSCFE